MVWLSWPGFVESLQSGETSPDAGGLLRWPVRLLIPLGFTLLGLQGISEAIKHIAFLGRCSGHGSTSSVPGVVRGEGKLTREQPREET